METPKLGQTSQMWLKGFGALMRLTWLFTHIHREEHRKKTGHQREKYQHSWQQPTLKCRSVCRNACNIDLILVKNCDGKATTVTWQCRVGLAPLGSHTVVPAGVGVLDKAAQVVEELGEGHVAGLVDGVVEQSGPPQRGVPPEQHAVDAGQTLLRGVGGLQVVLPPAVAGAPRLVAVVEPAVIMCAWWGEGEPVRKVDSVTSASLVFICLIQMMNNKINNWLIQANEG